LGRWIAVVGETDRKLSEKNNPRFDFIRTAILEWAECPRTDVIELQNFFSLITISLMILNGRNRASRMGAN